MKQLVQIIKNRATRAIPVKLAHLRLSAPAASFTFDDFSKNAWTNGGPLIEGYGGRATYYISGNLCGQTERGAQLFDESDLIELSQKGHDVGSHTFEHVPIPDLSSPAIEETLRKNHDYVQRITGRQVMTSFAYPFGLASVRTKQLLKDKFAACRGVYPGINAGWSRFFPAERHFPAPQGSSVREIHRKCAFPAGLAYLCRARRFRRANQLRLHSRHAGEGPEARVCGRDRNSNGRRCPAAHFRFQNRSGKRLLIIGRAPRRHPGCDFAGGKPSRLAGLIPTIANRLVVI